MINNYHFFSLCQLIIITFLNAAFCILLNVTGWRRFVSPNKGLRSKTRAGKMWWSKTPQRREATTGVLRNPSRLLAAKR
jgi:hypothetical protein